MLMLFASLPASAQQATSRDNAAVNLVFTVIDKKSKQFVTTLRREDIRVFEDGVQQEITALKQQTDRPLSIVIMLDMSISQERVIPIAKEVSQNFVNSLTRPGRDNVGVITFTGEAKFEQELTSNLDQVRRAIERVAFNPPRGYVGGGQVIDLPSKPSPDQMILGSTALWDSVWFASEKLSAHAPDNTRRIIVIITDGEDTSSKRKLGEAVEAAIQSGVAVYSMGMGDEYYGGTNKGVLQKISERTGGRAFFPKKEKDLQDAFAELEQELRSQYLISFSSTTKKSGNKIRKIKIDIVNPELRKQDLQLSHQQGYLTKG